KHCCKPGRFRRPQRALPRWHRCAPARSAPTTNTAAVIRLACSQYCVEIPTQSRGRFGSVHSPYVQSTCVICMHSMSAYNEPLNCGLHVACISSTRTQTERGEFDGDRDGDAGLHPRGAGGLPVEAGAAEE